MIPSVSQFLSSSKTPTITKIGGVPSVKEFANSQSGTPVRKSNIPSVTDYLSSSVGKSNQEAQIKTDNKFNSSLTGIAVNTIKGLPDAATTVGKAIGNTGIGIAKAVASPLVETGIKVGQVINTMRGTAPKNLGKYEDTPYMNYDIQAKPGVTNPLTGENVPYIDTPKEIIGRSAKTISTGLGPILGGATFMGGQALSENQQLFPNKEHPLANVTSQTILGGIGGKVLDYGMGTLSKFAKDSIPPVKLPVKSESVENAIPLPKNRKVELPVKSTDRSTKININQGNNYYPSPDSLPTIQMGNIPKAKETLPTIQMGETASKPKTSSEPLRYEYIETPTVSSNPTPKESGVPSVKKYQQISTPVQKTPRQGSVPSVGEYQSLSVPKSVSSGVPESVKPFPVEGGGITKIRTLAQGVEEKAVEAKLTQSFGDLPEYQTVSMKDQAQKAIDIISKDSSQAERIAMGKESAPHGVIPESIFVAVEERAIKTKNIDLLRRLATQSNLTTEATTMGQRIRTLAERNPDSPVTVIRDIQKSFDESATRKLSGVNIHKVKQTVAQQIKNTIRQNVPKGKDWDSFIASITC